MGDKISALPQATTLTGTELVPLVQGGATKQTTSASFKTTNAGDLVSGTVAIARLPVGSQASAGILQLGQNSGQACEANDARLSNSRPPNGTAGGDLSGTYPNPQLAPSGVAAGIYGSATISPQITVDAKGRIVNVGSATIPIPPASDLVPLVNGTGSIGNSDKYARQDHIHPASSTTLTGDVTGAGVGSVSTTLSNTGVAQGTYGSSTRIPIVTVDSKGRVLAANTVPFSSSAGGTVTSVDVSGGTTGLTASGGPITGDGVITLDGVLSVANGGTGAATASGAIASLGAVSTIQLGALNGVATLDGSGKVPLSQIPNYTTQQYATLDINGKVPLSELYAAVTNGLATLGGDGKVPSNQLPSYVDDVVEVANFSALPNPGETGKIYVTLDTNLTWRWSGSTYIQINAGPTPSSTTPLVAGTAAVGTSLAYARADHVHPLQAVPSAATAIPLVASNAGSVGTSTSFAREDHVHPTQAVPAISSTVPLIASGTGEIGSLTAYARADHVHPAQQVIPSITTQAGTTYTTVLSDAASIIRFTSSSQVLVTIPANSSVNYPIGTSITLLQSGLGNVFLRKSNGVELFGRGLITEGVNRSLVIQKVLSDTWVVSGFSQRDRFWKNVEYCFTCQNSPLSGTLLIPDVAGPSTQQSYSNYLIQDSDVNGLKQAIRTIGSSSFLPFSITGEFTVETTFKLVSTVSGSNHYAIWLRNSGGGITAITVFVNSGVVTFATGSNLTSITLALNTWCTVAVSRDVSNNVYCFVNGSLVGAVPNPSNNQNEITLPYSSTANNMVISQHRLTVGACRFTSSYTLDSVLPIV